MRKIFPFICIILLITTCILGILYFLSPKKDSKVVIKAVNTVNILRCNVESGIITSIIASEGNVIGNSPETYIENISLEFATSADSKLYSTANKIGDIVKKEDNLYTYKGNNFKVKSDYKIIDIVTTEKSVQFTLLNYNKLYVISKIPIDRLQLLNLNTKVTLSLEDKDKDVEKVFPAKIRNFGYEVTDGKVDVLIISEEKFLPGTSVKVKFEIVNKTESLFVLKEMLKKDGDIYYVDVETDSGTRVRKDVKLGEFFDTYNDVTKSEFVEITSGLKLGEKIIIDIME